MALWLLHLSHVDVSHEGIHQVVKCLVGSFLFLKDVPIQYTKQFVNQNEEYAKGEHELGELHENSLEHHHDVTYILAPLKVLQGLEA